MKLISKPESNVNCYENNQTEMSQKITLCNLKDHKQIYAKNLNFISSEPQEDLGKNLPKRK
jgi:hypothetical protein